MNIEGGGSPRQLTAYVAGSTKEIRRVQLVQDMVRDTGFKITFDWTGSEGEIRADWSGQARARGARIAKREIEACRCDLYVLVTPPGPRGLGCFIEMGAALAYGAVCLVLPLKGRDSVFWCHPGVRVCRNVLDMEHHIRRTYRLQMDGIERGVASCK